FFSYLFSVCVLLGVVTRSALAALLLTILFWLFCFGVGSTEVVFLTWKMQAEDQVQRLDRQINSFDERIARMDQPPGTTNPAQRLVDDFKQTRLRLIEERETAIADVKTWEKWHPLIYGIKTVVPKTGDTIGLLERAMLSDE